MWRRIAGHKAEVGPGEKAGQIGDQVVRNLVDSMRVPARHHADPLSSGTTEVRSQLKCSLMRQSNSFLSWNARTGSDPLTAQLYKNSPKHATH